ncbi:MAG: hypothetical protein HFJ33_06625 [Clostridia bacterium]|nr:hypothetical protein [Clostridia bacterium]
MEKFLKKSSWSDIVVSVLFMIFGFILIAQPEFVKSMISFLLGSIVIVIGVLKGIDYFASGKQDYYLLSVAIVAMIAGIVILFCADIITSIFRILIGLWIVYSGLINLQTTIVWKNHQSRLWFLTLILAIATILAGVYILVTNGAMLQIVGAIIVGYGIMNMIENAIFIKKVDRYLEL